MSVWLCIPSARPVDEVNARMAKWRERGYKIALWRDKKEDGLNAEAIMHGSGGFLSQTYPGYAVASNALINWAFANDPACDWVVCGGDDIDPDPKKMADEIAEECGDHFFDYSGNAKVKTLCGTFGVMQPTGDRWGADEPWALLSYPGAPAYADRICGSPWIGREFARRVNGGRGPWCEDYTHMFVDEHMQNVAQKLGVLWQRRDLTQYHDHCRRDGEARTPEFLREAYSQEHWAVSKAIFDQHKADGFAESLRLID